jgi:hypothetical protein
MSEQLKLQVRLNVAPLCAECGAMLLQVEKFHWACTSTRDCPVRGIILEEQRPYWPVVGKVIEEDL